MASGVRGVHDIPVYTYHGRLQRQHIFPLDLMVEIG